MTANAIENTALCEDLPDGFLQYDEIQTDDYSKLICYVVPNNSKGTIFLFHSTGGSIIGWEGVLKDQNFALLKMLYYNGFPIVISECQESTLETDLNGDVKIRWHTFPIDTINNTDCLHQNNN
ncbi:MAG: hypothetical protein PF448_09015 [Bacteroidales bacterium]|jgi:hypothetical protein|nr:hypothetical protein [Bacteroidales bacterium]